MFYRLLGVLLLLFFVLALAWRLPVSLGVHLYVLLQPTVASLFLPKYKGGQAWRQGGRVQEQCHVEFSIGDPENMKLDLLLNITQTQSLGFYVHSGQLSF